MPSPAAAGSSGQGAGPVAVPSAPESGASGAALSGRIWPGAGPPPDGGAGGASGGSGAPGRAMTTKAFGAPRSTY
ncbi:MAG: hypothetical protein AB1679_35410 [Actinomycetota bacterium]